MHGNVWSMGGKHKDRRSILIRMGYPIFFKVRNRIAEDNSWRCSYCFIKVELKPSESEASRLATIDHKIPLSRGGLWKRYNLTCACRGCNEDKGEMTDTEYRYYLFLMGRG